MLKKKKGSTNMVESWHVGSASAAMSSRAAEQDDAFDEFAPKEQGKKKSSVQAGV